MGSFPHRLQNVADHFKDGDTNLGYSNLIDCVLDTRSLEMYSLCIALTHWKESESYEVNEFISRATQLIEKLGHFDIAQNGPHLLLSSDNLSKSYGSRGFSLNNISLSLNSGEIIGLVGENGNGKTTLLRILAQELNYNSGTINYSFLKEKTSGFDLKTKLVYIPQRTPKWQGSLKANLK